MLKSIGLWLLKIVLGGIYGRVMARIEAEAEAKKQAALLHAKTTEQSAATEIAVEKAKNDVKEKYEKMEADPADPFNTDKWNGVSK
jgi:hypothetical protein